ncbi:MAG TPA: NAD(P)-binding domain-containing protein [Candidatus Dormibacteraeota bacterium]|nr:NAD(P)-binding domain-containing protein [Candidatus Dormibacteraeota bacterium]
MKVTIIGSGNVGRALAATAVKAGHSVTLAAAHPEHARDAAMATGASAADSSSAAVRDAEVVILAVPANAMAEVAGGLSAELEGKAVADTSNRVNPNDPGSVLDGSSMTEQMQALVPGARFVKAFNTNFAAVMANPVVDGAPADTFLAGDDAEAKARIAELARSLGYRVIDVGPAPMARVLEGMGLVNISLQIANGWPWQSSFRLAGPAGGA